LEFLPQFVGARACAGKTTAVDKEILLANRLPAKIVLQYFKRASLRSIAPGSCREAID